MKLCVIRLLGRVLNVIDVQCISLGHQKGLALMCRSISDEGGLDKNLLTMSCECMYVYQEQVHGVLMLGHSHLCHSQSAILCSGNGL